MQEQPPDLPNPEPVPTRNRKRIGIFLLITLMAVILVLTVLSLATPGMCCTNNDYWYTIVPSL